MSKVVVSLPQGMVKNSIIGGLLALGVYAAMQFLWAALIDRGLMGFGQLYPLVCVAAAVASFLGCGYSVLRGKGSAVLSVPVVIAVFLTLTLAAALLTADAVAIENGLTGIGLSMAAGGTRAGKSPAAGGGPNQDNSGGPGSYARPSAQRVKNLSGIRAHSRAPPERSSFRYLAKFPKAALDASAS